VPVLDREDPDGGSCDAFVAYHFDAGTIKGVDVGGLSIVNVVQIPGNVLTPGSWKIVMFVDERATDEQLEALTAAYGGTLGGPLADLAGLVGEVLDVRRVPIRHEIRDGSGTLSVGDFVSAEMAPYRGATVRQPRSGTRSSRRSPGSPAYVSKASSHTVNLPQYGMVWSFEGRNAIQSTTGSPSGVGVIAATGVRRQRRTPVSLVAAIGLAWVVSILAQTSGRAVLSQPRTAHRRARLLLSPASDLDGRAAVPGGLAGDGRGDDASLEPADDPALSSHHGGGPLAQPYPGCVSRRLPGRVGCVRAVAFANDVGIHRLVDHTPWLQAHPWTICWRGAGHRRAVPVLGGEGPVPFRVPPSRGIPAPALPSRNRRRVFSWAASTGCSAWDAAGRSCW